MQGKFVVFERIDNNYQIGLSDKLYDEIKNKIDTHTIKTYNILPARIYGLSYPDFLRYGRDKFNGLIIGKNSKYPYLIFKDKKDCNKICQELNKRLILIK